MLVFLGGEEYHSTVVVGGEVVLHATVSLPRHSRIAPQRKDELGRLDCKVAHEGSIVIWCLTVAKYVDYNSTARLSYPVPRWARRE